jgi:ketosteroid isomerase-like protein
MSIDGGLLDRRSFVNGLSTSLSFTLVPQALANEKGQRSSVNTTVEAQISDAEDRLRTAMLRSDVGVLSELLAPELIFTNHLGQLQGRESDIAAYRSGMLKIEHLVLSEQHILVVHEVGIVSVRAQLTGTYNGNPANGTFRFTRVWSLSPDRSWHVVAAHSGLVV